MMKRSLMQAGIVALTMSASVGTLTSPAQGADRDGKCESGEFCYYYNSDQQGSVSDFRVSVASYGESQPDCYEFRGPGNGNGRCIKNDAASIWNNTKQTVTVFYNSSYGGASQSFKPGERANLNSTLKNNNASHRIGSTTTPPSGQYGTPKDNPHPSEATRAPKASKRTQHVKDELARLTGQTRCYVGDYRSYQGPRTNHNTGNALDCTVSNAIGQRPSAAQRDTGWKQANWLRQHAARLDVRYVIFDDKIWSVARDAEGWRNYNGDGSVTGDHLDHVHVSIQNPYGDGNS